MAAVAALCSCGAVTMAGVVLFDVDVIGNGAGGSGGGIVAIRLSATAACCEFVGEQLLVSMAEGYWRPPSATAASTMS